MRGTELLGLRGGSIRDPNYSARGRSGSGDASQLNVLVTFSPLT